MPERPPLPVLLDWLLTRARPMMLDRYRADSCIAATRIASGFLEHFGQNVRPVPCSLTVYNRIATDIVAGGETLGPEHWDVGARVVQIEGTGRLTPRGESYAWDGHLVLAISNGPRFEVEGEDVATILDLSLDQASRPHKQVELHPLIFTVHGGWDRRQFGQIVNGCQVVYERIGNQAWRNTPDWKGATATHVTGEFIRLFTQEAMA